MFDELALKSQTVMYAFPNTRFESVLRCRHSKIQCRNPSLAFISLNQSSIINAILPFHYGLRRLTGQIEWLIWLHLERDRKPSRTSNAPLPIPFPLLPATITHTVRPGIHPSYLKKQIYMVMLRTHVTRSNTPMYFGIAADRSVWITKELPYMEDKMITIYINYGTFVM